MDSIKEALTKARNSPGRAPAREHRDVPGSINSSRLAPVGKSEPAWTPVQMELDPAHLARERVVSFATSDPAHIAFNQLRTRLLKLMRDNGWKNIAVTSPSQGCGKTVVAVNLSISLARVLDCRTVLLDLDLRRPSVWRVLGVRSPSSVGQYYEGKSEAADCFVQVAGNLSVGLGLAPVPNASELIQSPRTGELFRLIANHLRPDIVLFDLPPLLASDDALGFLPHVDAALLVVAAGASTTAEVDECERQIRSTTNLAGVVLNKADARLGHYKYYY